MHKKIDNNQNRYPMENKNEYLAAIDIGTTKIVTIVGRKNENNKLEIISLSKTPSTGVKRGLITNIEETVNAIRKTLEETKSRTGLSFKNVFVGIAGQHIRSSRNRTYRIIQSPNNEITREDVKALLDDMKNLPIEAGEEILHVIPQNYIVDMESNITTNPVGMTGKRLEGNFHIVIGNTMSTRNIERCIQAVGLNLYKLILEPLASSEAVLTDEEKEAGVALVDIGGGTTDIAIYHEKIIWHTAVIPLGGDVITKDIKEGCAILPRQAEELKIRHGSCLPEAMDNDAKIVIEGMYGRGKKEVSSMFLSGIIHARMDEILDGVIFEIESSGIMDKLSAGIVVTGGGALLRHLPQLIKFKTGMDVRIGYPCEHLTAATSDDINHPMYATAIGLLLKGYEYLDEHNLSASSLIPAEAENKEEPTMTKEKQEEGWLGNFRKFKDKLLELFEDDDTRM